MRETREQKRRRKLTQRKNARPIAFVRPFKRPAGYAEVTAANVLDLFAPSVVAMLDCGCCLASIGRRSNGERLIWIAEGTPCDLCERILYRAVQCGIELLSDRSDAPTHEVGVVFGGETLCCDGIFSLSDGFDGSARVVFFFEHHPCEACAAEATVWLRSGFRSVLSTDVGAPLFGSRRRLADRSTAKRR
jgi:hypothetical protein